MTRWSGGDAVVFCAEAGSWMRVGQALAAMRALVVYGYASGGPVGASFAFRVFDTT
ncbi:hypothetical protein MF271_23345 (plasmid) [Deinococcus sp. KNUC1210]|uniref:hypothetical protein n=1 Tax=Deinococcus sp. KNUC1210 TaxID=2917691 RepID=UPI001EF0300A|nr:hypothetical protein [Deinococcus sp. KNUC1210]ULH17909.1 hypothetical protein MF271_23345 [Deinococcus sp. KNUC1210]